MTGKKKDPAFRESTIDKKERGGKIDKRPESGGSATSSTRGESPVRERRGGKEAAPKRSLRT